MKVVGDAALNTNNGSNKNNLCEILCSYCAYCGSSVGGRRIETHRHIENNRLAHSIFPILLP